MTDYALDEHAAWLLHTHGGIPPESPEHIAARKALDELLSRCGGWDGMKRDDRRLAKRYQRTLNETKADRVAQARELGLLNHE